MYTRRVECVNYGYAAAVDRSQPACLALNELDELFLIGLTYDQRYDQITHDGERYGPTEIRELNVQVYETRGMHWCAFSSCVLG